MFSTLKTQHLIPQSLKTFTRSRESNFKSSRFRINRDILRMPLQTTEPAADQNFPRERVTAFSARKFVDPEVFWIRLSGQLFNHVY